MSIPRVFAPACVAIAFGVNTPAEAYPIDCAILLCLAGGFPASAECSAAHTEMIRRVTPWPIEPPLQLWRCPMNVGLPAGSAGGDVPDDVRHYREGIELWQVSKRSMNSSSGREVYRTISRHHYDEGGRWVRGEASLLSMPSWVDQQIIEHNGIGLAGDFGSFNGILMRYHDYRDQPSYEWISY